MAVLDTRPVATEALPFPGDVAPPGFRPPTRSRLRRAAAHAGLLIRRHPWLLTLAVSLLTVAFRLRGTDMPAAEYRALLFRSHGLVLWDDQWYGGHHLLGYSLLFPPTAGVFGVSAVGIASCVLSTWAVTRIVRLRYGDGSRSGGQDFALLWFAVAVVGDLAIGRLPFALGAAFAALAVLCVLKRRPGLATLAAAAASLASPLAGLFLLIGAAAWLGTRRAREVAPLLAATSGLACSLIFPEGGVFPFPFMTLVPLLIVAAIGLYATPHSAVLVRRALYIYTGLALLLFFIPTPVGGNLARPAPLLAGPAAAIVLRHRAKLVALLVLPLLLWQAEPVASAFTNAGDPSSHWSYYSAMVQYVDDHDAPLGRVEIPFTRNHWEARFVAPHIPLARGWERQLDTTVNAALYAHDLTALEYKTWLLSRGVRFVALPDVPLDPSAKREAAILLRSQPFLKPVWSDAHWTVWQVVPTPDLALGPATVTKLGVDGFTVHFTSPGTAEVLVNYSSYWRAWTPSTPGDAPDPDQPSTSCVARSPGGWTLVHSDVVGDVQVAAQWSVGRMLRSGSNCSDAIAQVLRPH